MSTRTCIDEWCRNASGKEEQSSETAEGFVFTSLWSCEINKHLVSRILDWFSLYLSYYLKFFIFLITACFNVLFLFLPTTIRKDKVKT